MVQIFIKMTNNVLNVLSKHAILSILKEKIREGDKYITERRAQITGMELTPLYSGQMVKKSVSHQPFNRLIVQKEGA